jgi:hypothetical protein
MLLNPSLLVFGLSLAVEHGKGMSPALLQSPYPGARTLVFV